MTRQNYIIVIYLAFIMTTNVYANNSLGLTQNIYKKLCGVWDLNKSYNSEKDYSWGKAKVTINGSVVIDLGDNQPFFFIGGMGKLKISKVDQVKDKFIIRILFRDNNEYNIELSIIDGNSIIFHEMKWFKNIQLFSTNYGEKYKYYKISGPIIKYYKPKIANLRFRGEPSIQGKIIRLLNANEKLLQITIDKEEIIEGVKGKWIKVLTENNEFGWCFNSYLENI